MVSGPAAPVPTPDIPKGQLRNFLAPHAFTQKQLDGMVAFLRWAAFAADSGDDARELPDGTIVIHRSVPQIIRGMGLPAGPTVQKTHNRWRNQVYRWVRYLRHLGLTAREGPRGAKGQGTGILVFIPAGVAQSVRATLARTRRNAPALRRPISWGKVSSPPTGLNSSSGSAVEGIKVRTDGARASATGHATGPPGDPSGPGDFERPANGSTGEVAAALAAWRANTRKPPRLSARAALLIERYCALLDREVGRAGYAIGWLEDQIEDRFDPHVNLGRDLGRLPWDREAPPDGGRPKSLGYFVRLLRRQWRLARRWRPASGPDRVDRLPRGQVVDVASGRRQIGVAEQAADDVQRDALPGELGRERVPEAVRVYPLLDPRTERRILQRLPHVGRIEGLPERGATDDAEEWLSAGEPEPPALLEPSADDRRRLWIDSYHSTPVALAVQDDDRARGQVDVLRRQGERLADAQAAAPQHDDERPVASAGVPPPHGGHDPVDLVPVEDFGRIGLSSVRGPHAQTVVGHGDDGSPPTAHQVGALHSSVLSVGWEGTIRQSSGSVAPTDAAASATRPNVLPEGDENACL